MSRSLARRYRVRIATRGATDITSSTVDFILEVPDMAAVPVVAGSFVHPLDGATELRPVHVLGVDYQGGLIELFAVSGRWAMVGRLIDIQHQLAADDPVADPWTTYGTGRCSGIDELDGPGRFRVEIADESWVARTGEIFNEADTTQIWPAGLIYPWRGFGASPRGSGTQAGNDGDIYRINVSGPGAAGTLIGSRGIVSAEMLRWIKNNQKSPTELSLSTGSFRDLRLNYDGVDYEVHGFGSAVTPGGVSFSTLEAAEASGGTSFTVWILWPGVPFVVPPASGDAYLYAPTAEPSDSLPLHIGVEDDTHKWGYPAESTGFGVGPIGGYLHVADITRRFWEELGVRYDVQNLYDLEQDTSFSLLAPYILAPPSDPHKWMQANVWGPRMLLALRDAEGRMKLADLRAPQQVDASTYPLLDAANSKDHRWRLVGRDTINEVVWEYSTLAEYHPDLLPPAALNNLTNFGVVPSIAGDAVEGPRLDFIARRIDTLGPLLGDTQPYVGRRTKTFSAHHTLEPLDPLWPGNTARLLTVVWTGRGVQWAGLGAVSVGNTSQLMLDIYQDGPMLGTAEISGTVAETVEEGDYVVVDCTSVKVANAGAAARLGKLLVLLLSVTRYPAHSEIEYLVIRPVFFFECPDPDDPSTWLLSPFGQATTVLVTFLVPEPLSPDLLTFRIRARKNAAGGDTINMGVALTYRIFSLSPFLFAEWVEYDVSEFWTEYEFTLDATEQAQIVDWTQITLEITRGGTIDADPANWRRLEISKIWVP